MRTVATLATAAALLLAGCSDSEPNRFTNTERVELLGLCETFTGNRLRSCPTMVNAADDLLARHDWDRGCYLGAIAELMIASRPDDVDVERCLKT